MTREAAALAKSGALYHTTGTRVATERRSIIANKTQEVTLNKMQTTDCSTVLQK